MIRILFACIISSYGIVCLTLSALYIRTGHIPISHKRAIIENIFKLPGIALWIIVLIRGLKFLFDITWQLFGIS